MTLITFKPSGNAFPVEGGTILEAMLAHGEKVTHNCDGKATCGGCHIFLLEGRKGVSRLSPEENAKLDTMVGIGSKSRLACQCTILGTEDVTVEVLSFV
jgi:ferredoxin, 2Fe-2S